MSNNTSATNENFIYTNNTDNMSDKNVRRELVRRLLKNLTDEELIKVVRTREQVRQPMPTPRRPTNGIVLNNSLDKTTLRRRPVPTPRSLKELVKQ